MTPLEPKLTQRPLFWPDSVLDLQDMLIDNDEIPPVYIVGGAVRDAYRHHPVHDLDLATPGEAVKLGRWIANAFKGDIFVMDQERDVARVLLDTPDGRLVIDIAGFRGRDLLKDLQDRDFTFNAIAVDLLGDLSKVIDPLDGVTDLDKRIIRRCSETSLSDDPIRALRAIRQSVQFSARIEPATVVDIRAVVPRLSESSPERIRDEFFKMLGLDKPAMALRVAKTLGLLDVIIPEVSPMVGLQQPPPHIFDGWQYTLMVVEKFNTLLTTISPKRTDLTASVFDMGMVVVSFDVFRQQLQQYISQMWPNDRSQWQLLMLGALLHALGKPLTHSDDHSGYETHSAEIAEKTADALRLSNDEKVRLVRMVANHNRLLTMPAQLSDLDLHRYWYELGESGVDACLLTLVSHLGMVGNEINQDRWVRLLEQAQILLHAYYKRYDEVVSPALLVNGKDLMETLGIPSGKHIGAMLTRIREGQVTGEIKTIEAAIEAAREYYNSPS